MLRRRGHAVRTVRTVVVALLALVALAATATVTTACGLVERAAGGHPTLAPDEGLVVRVVDGDTLVVRTQAGDERVRLLGIDTPETVDPRRPVECFGKEASAHLASLLPPGTSLRLVRDVELRDQYSRLLAYAYRADDGLFVNLEMVREGYASVLTYPPNVAHSAEFAAAAAEARMAGRGLWSAC